MVSCQDLAPIEHVCDIIGPSRGKAEVNGLLDLKYDYVLFCISQNI